MGLIINHKDSWLVRRGKLRHPRDRLRGVPRLGLDFTHRQSDAEGRAAPDLRLDRDLSLVPPDDAVADGEAQPQPVFALRREERVEDARAYFRAHARAGVGDGNFDRAVRLLGGESNLSAPRHRVHGVEDHVDENLAQLGVVAEYERAGIYLRVNVDVHAGDFRRVFPARARDLDDVEQQLVYGHQLEVPVAALPREVLYAFDGLRAVLRGLRDDLQPAHDLRLLRAHQRQLRASEDAGQRVVEIVRDAGGEHAERGEFLDLRELLADALLLLDVAGKLFDVLFGYLDLPRRSLDVFEIRRVGKVDDDDDRGRHQDGVE